MVSSCYFIGMDGYLIFANMFCVAGIKESDTGLAQPSNWDLAADKQTLQSK